MTRIVNEMTLPLEDGESWDDTLTVTLNRGQWTHLLAMCSMQLEELESLLGQMSEAGKSGDIIATLLSPQVRRQGRELRDLTMDIVRVVKPRIAAEVDANETQSS